MITKQILTKARNENKPVIKNCAKAIILSRFHYCMTHLSFSYMTFAEFT